MNQHRYLPVLIVLAIFVQLNVLAVDPKTEPSTVNEKMDKLFEDWNRPDRPAGAVCVVKDDAVLYQKCFGLANLEYNLPIGPKTVFDTATLAQPITGMAVAMLEAQGQLSLDDDVRKYIPELPDYGQPITLRHLVCHRSGLRDWLPVFLLHGGQAEDIITTDQILKQVNTQKKLRFPPGSKSEFSGTNYFLLAEVIKRKTGQPFRDWTWTNIFKPLKMTRTLFRDSHREIVENRAYSYNHHPRDGYLKGADNLSAVGSHCLYSNIDDLAKWLLNLDSGRVGGAVVMQKLFTAIPLSGGAPGNFGYGFEIDTFQGTRRASQGGEWGGFRAALQYFPEKRFGVVVLSNWDYSFQDPSDFAREVASLYLAEPAKTAASTPPAAPPVEIKLDPAIFDRYVGSYRLQPRVVYNIIRESDQLKLAVGGMKLQLFPTSETDFFIKEAPAQITFLKDAEGKITKLHINYGPQSMDAIRFEPVDPATLNLNDYTGNYFNDEYGLHFTIALKDGKLVLSPGDQREIILTPEAREQFVGNSRFFQQINFSRSEQKLVTGFVLDNLQINDVVFKKK